MEHPSLPIHGIFNRNDEIKSSSAWILISQETTAIYEDKQQTAVCNFGVLVCLGFTELFIKQLEFGDLFSACILFKSE